MRMLLSVINSTQGEMRRIRRTDKDTAAHAHNGIPCCLKKKEILPYVTDNMGEPGGHHSKWNKPDTEGQILHDFTSMKYLKEVNS